MTTSYAIVVGLPDPRYRSIDDLSTFHVMVVFPETTTKYNMIELLLPWPVVHMDMDGLTPDDPAPSLPLSIKFCERGCLFLFSM